ncbi:MAG: DUF222 domain-containing protein [Arachnia sp.]
MNDTMRSLGQHALATGWEAARSASFIADRARCAAELGDLLGVIDELEAQLAGLRLQVLHEARLAGADQALDRVKTSTRTTTAQATAAIRLATELADRFPLVGAALQDGTISLPQAEAIASGLRKLPSSLTARDVEVCQREILVHAAVLGPAELRILAARMLEVVDPAGAERDEAARLAREERQARRERFLRLTPDFHGSVRIAGQLPVADGALLSAQLEALMPPAATYRETDEAPGPDARRADALVLLTQLAASSGELPAHGLDRPHLHVTMTLETLTTGLGRVGLLGQGDGAGLSAAEARRLACDASIIPVVLGSASEPLDVGREARLFTKPIRAALTLRDQGCVFPGCTVPPAGCEAHHITPWWTGAETKLSNAVLLCPHHHRLVEPDRQQSAMSQWQVHLDAATGLPVFTPPRHVDPTRSPRQHQRHVLQQLKVAPPPKAPPCPPPPPPEIPTPKPDPWAWVPDDAYTPIR